MEDLTLDTLLLVGVSMFAIYAIYRGVTREERVEVLYGYPAHCRTWLTVYHYRKSDRWIFEWDDLFDEGRPKSWPINQHFLYEDRKSGATREEFEEAWKLCQKRGLI